MGDDWEIMLLEQTIVEVGRGSVTLEWTLNQAPDPQWLQFLQASGEPKSGSRAFLECEPTLYGDRLCFLVPDMDLESAVRWVKASVPVANQKYYTHVLARRRREEAYQQDQEKQEEARLQRARERLNALGDSD
jgi:hypothetical protein